MIKRKIIFTAILLCADMGVALAAAIDSESPRKVVADVVEYDARDKTIRTGGNTTITNASGQKVNLRDSYLSPSGGDISGQDLEMQLSPQIHITAEKIVRNNELTDATGATYTACYECDEIGNAWEISTTRLKHDNIEHELEFFNPVLRIYGVPVLWFPKLNYPDPSVRHKSGILIPDFNSTNNMGTQFNIPIYIALSDRHDLTLTASVLTDENPLWQLEHRLNANHMEFRTSGSFTHNSAGEDRWHIFNNDTIEMGEHIKTSVFFARTSDKTYLQKYGFYSAQPYLDSGARTEFFAESGYATAEAHFFQELRSTRRSNQSNPSGDILPQIHGVYQTGKIFSDTYFSFMGDILGIMNNDTGTSAQRAIGGAEIISPWTIWGGNRLTFGLSARYDIYNFKNTDMTDGAEFSGVKNRFLPSGYVEWGIPLVRPGQDWTQTIQPRVRLTAMTPQSDSAFAAMNDSAGALLSDSTLFSSNRFSGYDVWENGTYMDYGVNWSAYNLNGDSAEIFVGQTYDFKAQEDIDPNSGFRRGFSDYVGRLSYENNRWLGIYNRFRISEEDFSLRHLETSLRIGGRNFISGGHIWARQFLDAGTLDKTINEITGGIGFYLTDRFTVRWNAIYNITDERFQGHKGGIYYDHPCYTLGLEYARDNAIKEDYVGNTKLRFQFSLKINGDDRALSYERTFSDLGPISNDEQFANF